MTNKAQRIILCCIGIPVLLGLLVFLPQFNFIGISLLVIVLIWIASLEMGSMIYGKNTLVSCLAPLLPLMTYLLPAFSEVFLCLSVLVVLIYNFIKSEKNGFENSITDVSKDFLILIYPSYLGCYLIKFFALDNVNTYSILLFMLIVFSNDSFAYVFGLLLGKTNKGILKTSPKKSIAGFIGGFASALIFTLLFCKFFASYLPLADTFSVLAFTSLAIISGDLGDLIESVFKRSAGVKDSGTIIPGRGGVLDCLDSILLTAPLFYFVFNNLR